MRGEVKIIIALFFLAANSSFATDLDAKPIKGSAIDGAELVEHSCQILSENGKEPSTLRDATGMHVLDRTKENPLVLLVEKNVKIMGVVCWREPAKFSKNDYLVPENLGFRLYIKTDNESDKSPRTLVLEKKGKYFNIRLLSGPDFTKEEESEIISLLTYYNKAVNGT